MVNQCIYITASELASIMGVSNSRAYKLIRKMNSELKKPRPENRRRAALLVPRKMLVRILSRCKRRHCRWGACKKRKSKVRQEKRRKAVKCEVDKTQSAEELLREFLSEQKADFDITFSDFIEMYFKSISPRLRENTLRTKHYIVDLKILPYFGAKKINEITPANIIDWENEMLSKGYSQTYMKSVYNQLNAIFNYAVRYYDLRANPCAKAGAIGKSKAEEMNFWTKDEFERFVECIADKPMSYAAFYILFWTGLRIGELLALTPADINFDKKTLAVNKSYQRLDNRDVITPPKTPKSKRVISIPDFLCELLKAYCGSLQNVGKNDRIFPFTKYYLHYEMRRGCKKSGVKRIRLHDIRHSHCALLYELGIPPLEIAERLGHERVETTMQVYAHLYPNKQEKLSAKLEEFMKNENEEKGA